MDMENDYFVQDGQVQDLIEEFLFGNGDVCNSIEEEEELMDEEEGRLNDCYVTPRPMICMNPRCDLTSTLQTLDPDFCDAVLPFMCVFFVMS